MSGSSSWLSRLPLAAVRARLAPFSPGSGPLVAALVALALVSTLAESAALVLVARSGIAVTSGTDRVDVGPGIELASSSALGIALVALLVKLVLNSASAWLGARLSARTVRQARLTILDSYFNADWRTQSEERMGELQDYLTTSVGRLNSINQSFVAGLNALLSFTVVILVALAVDVLAAVGCAVAGASLVLLFRPLAQRSKNYAWAQSEATRDLAGDVTETVRVSQEVRVFGVRPAVLRRLDAAEARASRPLLLGNFASAIAPSLYQTLTLALLVVAVAGVGLVDSDGAASLAAAVVLLLRGLGYGQQLQGALHSLAASLPFLDAVHARKERYDANRERPGYATITHIGRILLDRVTYSYPPGPPVLQDLTLSIEPREVLGVVGPSGSGKSTLLQLLLRLRAPTSGSIRVGGVDLWDVTAEAWAERVAFVAQDSRLLNGTVRENIRFFRPLDDDAVEGAARAAHIHDEVLSWPAGYETQVGDAGSRLSGGQRQRIAIARALAGDPDLLVLDEPTSALDLPSEARLQRTLSGLRGRVGLVIVAHRLSTLARCDRILVLRDGRCEGVEPPERLAESSTFYREALRLSLLPGGPEGEASQEHDVDESLPR